MYSHTFDTTNPISILGFLKNFKLACHSDVRNEGAAMELLNFFRNQSASEVLNERLSAEPTDTKASRKPTVNSTYLTSYPQVVKFLLEKYATDDVVPKTE